MARSVCGLVLDYIYPLESTAQYYFKPRRTDLEDFAVSAIIPRPLWLDGFELLLAQVLEHSPRAVSKLALLDTNAIVCQNTTRQALAFVSQLLAESIDRAEPTLSRKAFAALVFLDFHGSLFESEIRVKGIKTLDFTRLDRTCQQFLSKLLFGCYPSHDKAKFQSDFEALLPALNFKEPSAKAP